MFSQGHCRPARTRQEASQGHRRQHPRRPARPRAVALPRPLQVASQGHRSPGLCGGRHHPARLCGGLSILTAPCPPAPPPSLATRSRGPLPAKAKAGGEPWQPGWRRAEPAPASSARRTELPLSAPAPLGFAVSLPAGSELGRPLAGFASRRRQGRSRPAPVSAAAAVPGPAVLRSVLLFTFTCLLATPHPLGWGPRRASSGPPAPGCLPSSARSRAASAAAACRRLPARAPAWPDPGKKKKKNLSEAVSAAEGAGRSSGERGQLQRGANGSAGRESRCWRAAARRGVNNLARTQGSPDLPGTLLSEVLGDF